MSYNREIEDIIDALKKAKANKINVNLLIGAGCSISAGIPSANGIIDVIKKKYVRDYERAETKDYATCMSKLTPTERKNLIMEYVIDAKINWAHLGIAQLIKHGYINRVLTTNFDNLVLRACSLLNEYPAVYDLATSKQFRSDLLFDKSVLYLHGQHTGFILCNTKNEVEEQAELLRTVFNDLKQKSLWLVIGYSGQNDAVYKLLSEEEVFEHRLFWIGHKKNKPTDQLDTTLLNENKYAFYVSDYDADDFFVSLMKSLNCFPPELIKMPFTYLNKTLDSITQYTLPLNVDLTRSKDPKVSTSNIIKQAIESIENNDLLMSKHLLSIGLIDEAAPLLYHLSKENQENIVSDVKASIEELVLLYKMDIEEVEKKNIQNMNIRDIYNHAQKLMYVGFFEEDNSIQYLEKSCSSLEIVVKHTNKNNLIRFTLATNYSKLARLYGDINEQKAIELYKKAYDIYKEVYSNDSNNIEIVMNWIMANISLANLLEDEDYIINILKETLNIAELAYEENKNNEILLTLWGNAYRYLSGYIEDEEQAVMYLEQACMRFEKASTIDKADAFILYEWGECLLCLSTYKEDSNNKYELLENARDKFYCSIRLDASDEIVYSSLMKCYINMYSLDYEKSDNFISANNTGLLACENNIKGEWIFYRWSEAWSIFLDNNRSIDAKYTEMLIKYSNCICEYLQSNQICNKEGFITELNQIAYSLINLGEFIISEKLLKEAFNIDNDAVYINATNGLWYLKNNSIEESVSLELGEKLYLKSIGLVKEDDSNFANALLQKYKYELAVFYYRRKNNILQSKQYINESLDFGEIHGFEYIYADIIELQTEILNSHTTYEEEVAVAE